MEKKLCLCDDITINIGSIVRIMYPQPIDKSMKLSTGIVRDTRSKTRRKMRGSNENVIILQRAQQYE